MWKEALTWFRNLWIPLPVEGWDTRLAEYQNGKTVWKHSEHPKAVDCAPWPADWIPHRKVEPTEENSWQVIEYVPTPCSVTGKIAEMQCCRCGVPIHGSVAGLELNPMAPPSCPKCRKAVRRFIEQC